MANVHEVEIQLNEKLVAIINWLREYKQAADDVLSILVEIDVPPELKSTQEKALHALNIGAHKDPEITILHNPVKDL